MAEQAWLVSAHFTLLQEQHETVSDVFLRSIWISTLLNVGNIYHTDKAQ